MFYNVLIPELYIFLSQRSVLEIINSLIINFGEDTCNCNLSMPLLSLIPRVSDIEQNKNCCLVQCILHLLQFL